MEEIFNTYAQKILNNSILVIKDKRYRICEIEMYYCNDKHDDKYTHCDELQLEYNKFYFHRFRNKTFKCGTYKCMDITYGNKETKTYFGILIRSVKNIDTNEFFTGPCICVNEFLGQYDCKEFKEFVDKYDVNVEFNLIEQKITEEKIFIGPRVGLGEKYPEFKEKKYRYATNIKFIKKQKVFELLGE
jgi:hypothetical protein